MPVKSLLVAAALALALAPPAVAPAVDEVRTVSRAIALSRSTVRIHFARPVTAETAATVADLTLTMGGEPRTLRAVALAGDGRSAKLTARPRWPHGTAGEVRVKQEPAVRVYAAPGDTTAPILTRVRLARRTVCVIGLSRSCASSGGTIRFRVNEAATIVVDGRRRERRGAPSLLKVATLAGAGSVRFGSKIEGLRLRPGAYRLTVTAVDAAGNRSRSFTLPLRVRR